MTRKILLILGAALLVLPVSARSEDKKTVGEKTSDAWDKTKEVAKDAGEAIADKTREAVDALENVVDKPAADARQVKVEISDHGIAMDQTLSSGKTAFMVKNTGKEKHNFEIEGADLQKSFWLAIDPGDSKILQVDLKAGSYEADCKLHKDKESKTKLTVK